MEEISFSKKKMNDIEGVYVGEPAGEHCTDRLGMAEDSHMVKDWYTFKFKVVALL